MSHTIGKIALKLVPVTLRYRAGVVHVIQGNQASSYIVHLKKKYQLTGSLCLIWLSVNPFITFAQSWERLTDRDLPHGQEGITLHHCTHMASTHKANRLSVNYSVPNQYTIAYPAS